jgi:hypothetical protein
MSCCLMLPRHLTCLYTLYNLNTQTTVRLITSILSMSHLVVNESNILVYKLVYNEKYRNKDTVAL